MNPCEVIQYEYKKAPRYSLSVRVTILAQSTDHVSAAGKHVFSLAGFQMKAHALVIMWSLCDELLLLAVTGLTGCVTLVLWVQSAK